MNVSLPTETSAGKAWVEKYLHPPSVQKSNFVATPDNNISPVTTLNFETINNIPLTCRIGEESHNISEVFFLQTTGARVVAYVFVRSPTFNSGEWFQHPQVPAILNDSYDFLNNWTSDVALQRMSYKSCTYYLNATAFNDQGTVTVAQTRPEIFLYKETNIPPTDDEMCQDIDSPTQPARRVGGEFNYTTQMFTAGDVSGTGVIGAFVPASPTQVQQSNPKAVTHMARDGAFVPQHWSQPVNRFYDNAELGNGSTLDLVQCWVRFAQADKSEHDIRLFVKMKPDGTIPEPTLLNCGDTPWSDFTFGYVYFSALSVSPSSATALVSNAYITVKSVYGIEVQPHVKSAFVFFQQTPPVPDDRAIHVAAGIVHQKPDGYPAAANDFGSILGLVANYAPKIIDWISNAFGSKSTPAVAAAPAATTTVVRRRVKKDVQKAKKDRNKPRKETKDIRKLTRDMGTFNVRTRRRRFFRRQRPIGMPAPTTSRGPTVLRTIQPNLPAAQLPMPQRSLTRRRGAFVPSPVGRFNS